MPDYRKSCLFKLFSCKYRFEKLLELRSEGNMSSQNNRNKIYAEIEAFFFTIDSALDMLAQEINCLLGLDVKTNAVSFKSIVTPLKKSVSEKSKTLSVELEKFSTSELFENMKNIRNITTHRNILEELRIKMYPPQALVPDLASKLFKKTFVFDRQVVRLDKAFCHEFEIESSGDYEKMSKDSLPNEFGKLRYIEWEGRRMSNIMEQTLCGVSDFISKIHKILDDP